MSRNEHVAQLGAMNVDELRGHATELRDQLFRLRMQHQTGQLERPSVLRETKKKVARVETVLGERLRAL